MKHFVSKFLLYLAQKWVAHVRQFTLCSSSVTRYFEQTKVGPRQIEPGNRPRLAIHSLFVQCYQVF